MNDIRPKLNSIKTIDELRKYVDELCKKDRKELCSIWSLSEEHFTEEDVESVRNDVKNLVNQEYDEFLNLPENVFIRQYIPEEEKNLENKEGMLITYLFAPSLINKFFGKYAPYDSLLRKYAPEDWKFDEHVREITPDPGTVGMLRLLYPYPRMDEEGGIQVFTENIFDGVKSNVYMPWGPYTFTPFCNTSRYSYDKITEGEMIEEVDKFINDYKIKRL